VAVEDCLNDASEGPEDPDACHFDLKLFPRTTGTPVETVVVPVGGAISVLGSGVSSLEFDERNDLLLIQGRRTVTFYARSQVSGSTIDAGPLSSLVTPLASYENSADSSIRYCD
jgi:hypothetical protein